MSAASSGPGEIPGTKQALRAELRARVRALDPEAARRAAERIAERVLGLPEVAGAGGVLSCLSFRDELDTWGLVERLLAAGKEVYVPRAEPRDRRLHLHLYPCELETLSFGLRQPPSRCPQLPENEIDDAIDAVLVLGVGFDRRGIRLGQGGGYFDRFLAAHPDLTAVALAYEVQLVDRLPAEPHDVPMDVLVTEERVLRFDGVA